MKAAVLGAGVMGAAIAGHLANVGVQTYLLDLPSSLTKDRNRIAQEGKDRLLREKPSPLYSPEVSELIHVGNFEDDLAKLRDVDWIIEAVVEKLAIKQQLWAKVEKVWTPGTVVSTNTSGISIQQIAQGRSSDFRKYFLGTHFFNPPRYMRLLELIPTDETDRQVIHKVKQWAEERLGKGVVIGRDTPNFIANRIGTYGMMVTFDAMQKLGLTPDEVDTVTGKALARPKSATFRTLDLVGLDTFYHVATHMYDQLADPEEKQAFVLPEWFEQMIKKGLLGQKAGKGFYQKRGKEILTLDLATMQYRSRRDLNTPSLAQAKRAKNRSERLQTLIYADDIAGKLAWQVTKQVLLYAAKHVQEIADDLTSIDQAMKWGFHWELGPFELWDAIGVIASVKRMRQEGESLPSWLESFLQQGHTAFYQSDGARKQVFTIGRKYSQIPKHERELSLSQLKADGKRITGNKGASLIDLGDGIACLEFHSPKGAIGPDIIQLIPKVTKLVERDYQGLVIGNQNPHFCVGANLFLMLMEAQEGNWDEIDLIIRQFQHAILSLRQVNRPVVAAPFGRVLGGGVEVCLPADRMQASAESYMGLVEVGVGLIPAGGGCLGMLERWTSGIPQQDQFALQPMVNHVFELIGQAKVSTSAQEAKQMKMLRETDGITLNPDFLLYDAKQAALGLARAGYRRPDTRKIRVVGQTGFAVLKLGAYNLLSSGLISEYDYHIAKKLAYVLAGGNLPAGSEVSDQVLLDLEREAFLSLIGEPKTQARMQYMLRYGKPLRN